MSNNPFGSAVNRVEERYPQIQPETSPASPSPYAQQYAQQYAQPYAQPHAQPHAQQYAPQPYPQSYEAQQPPNRSSAYSAYLQPQQLHYQPPPPSTADFDPYHSLSALQQPQTDTSLFSSSSQSSHPPFQQTLTHPRRYVQENKQLLANFDEYTWKQLLHRVDAVREAWDSRVNELSEYKRKGADMYTIEQLEKEAQNTVDSIHASKFQLSEVHSGWRQSTDAASKARVREALNSSLASLSEYPTPLQINQLGGSLQRNQQEEMRKQSILSGYGGAQQQGGYEQGGMGYGAMQQQMTGYPGMMSQQPTGYHQPQQQQQQPPQQQQQYQGGMYQPSQQQYYQ